MCARLLACPLCSQPRFLTLDALRAGLVSVATRPLVCPVCNEVLLGIDKLTIHLFGHTINLSNNAAEPCGHADDVVAPQNWNVLKVQQTGEAQLPNDRSCMDSSDPELSVAGSKTSTINSRCQTQSRDKNNYNNYDVIRVNILAQSDESCNVASRPPANLQEQLKTILKTKCAMQYSRNDDIEYLNASRENAENATASADLSHGWTERQSCKSLVATEAAGVRVDTNIYQGTTEIESNDNRRVTKEIMGERPMINLMDKESELPDFQSMQNAMPMRAGNASTPEKRNAEQNGLRDATTNGEDRDSNSQGCRRALQTKILETAAKERTERCDVCGFHFSDANILALHQQLVHEQDLNGIAGKVLKNYSCHLCSKVFKMRGSLMVHMRVAHFGHNLGSLSRDGQTEHLAQSGDAGYNCPTCGKKFKKEQHVIQHLKTHEGKQWECDICSKMFTTKYFLKKHKRLHSGEMPYKCKICDKSFTFQQSYHKHRLYHKDDKPHTCATCGRSFKELSTLHNHERIHTGEKPFACETCGKCFRQRVSYLVHRRIHTGVMPYKCTMCGKSFRYKVSQRTHKCPAQSSGNTQQPSDTTGVVQQATDETVRLQAALQEDRSTINAVDNEENKFVLIINAQGQHVLAPQSKVNVSFEKNERMEFGGAGNTNGGDSRSKIWNNEDLDSVALEESAESIEVRTDSERLDVKNTNDLFSLMMMSRFENSASSPTYQMEHLRVSSPKVKENSIEPYIDFPQIADGAQVTTVRTDMEQSLTRDKDVSDSLQTINVESLKELLYGMDKK